jgi:hypothetical protein
MCIGSPLALFKALQFPGFRPQQLNGSARKTDELLRRL